MKLLVHTYFPVLSNLQVGGAEQIVHDLICGLATRGIEMVVMCPETERTDLLVQENVRVVPTLKTVKNRPLYPHERVHNWQQISQYAKKSDLVWCHDCVLPIKVSPPVILTVDQFSYKDEMDSILSFQWDSLIVLSQYLWEVIQAVINQEAWEGTAPLMKVIPCGINTNLFQRTDSRSLCDRLGISPDEDYLLFPHRPDPNKGFDTALEVLQKLHQQGYSYKLLVPVNPTYPADKRYYNMIRKRSMEMGIGENLIFHPWLAMSDMPAYYSLGKYVLVLGSVPEGFGLTPVQAISCGTPVVSTRAGALNEQFSPECGVRYVDFFDPNQVITFIKEYPSVQDIIRGRNYVEKHYDISRVVKELLQCFTETRKTTGIYNPLYSNSVRLSPWCRMNGKNSVWHDYRMRTYKLSAQESELIQIIKQGLLVPEMLSYKTQLEKLKTQGILI